MCVCGVCACVYMYACIYEYVCVNKKMSGKSIHTIET